MSRAQATFAGTPLVEEAVARDLVAAVLVRARLDGRSQLTAIAHEALQVALNRRELVWAAALSELRRHSLCALGVEESEEDRARAALDVRLGVAQLLASGLRTTRGAWCQVAAVGITALAAAAEGLLRRELLAIVRDVRACDTPRLDLATIDLLAEVPPSAPTGVTTLDAFANRLRPVLKSAIERLQVEVTTRATRATAAASRPSRARRSAPPASGHAAARASGRAGAASTPALLTLEQACDYLGLSRSAFYRRLADPRSGLRAIARPLPGSGHLRFDPGELSAWSAQDRQRGGG